MFSGSPQKSQLIQAYMILHSQQTNVRRRLSVDSTSSSSSSSSGSPSSSSSPSSFSSPSPSPAMSFSSTPNSPSPATRRGSRSSSFGGRRRSSISPPLSPTRSSIPPIPEEPIITPHLTEDEMKYADISNRIKTTLTDLLNCDAVKGDARMRSWVATRLMDVEHELKNQRRRHSSDTEHADLIASHLRE